MNRVLGFQPQPSTFQGIRLTHQPSPLDWGFFLVSPTPLTDIPRQEDLYFRQSSYRIQEAIFQPHYLAPHLRALSNPLRGDAKPLMEPSFALKGRLH